MARLNNQDGGMSTFRFFNPSWISLLSVTFFLGSFAWPQETGDPAIQITSVNPAGPHVVYPSGSGSLSMDFNVTVTNVASVNPDNFHWRFRDNDTGLYWSGTNWIATQQSIPVTTGSGSFWQNGSATETLVSFSAPENLFDGAFWNGISTRNLNLGLTYRHAGFHYFDGVNREFHNGDSPSVVVTNLGSTSFQFDPGDTQAVTLSFDITTNAAGGQAVWAWQDSANGLYWDGTQWVSASAWFGIGSGSGFWANGSTTPITGGVQIGADFDAPQIADPFWNGNRQIEVHLAWLENGVRTAADQNLNLDLNWNLLPAANAGPLGQVNEPQVTFNWPAVEGAQSYRIRLFEAGDPNFGNLNLSGTPTTTTTSHSESLTPNTVYHLFMATRDQSLTLGPTVLLGTVEYVPPTFTYGTPAPTTVEIDVSNPSQEIVLSLPYSHQNVTALQPDHLSWQWHSNDGGYDSYYINNWTAGSGYHNANIYFGNQVQFLDGEVRITLSHEILGTDFFKVNNNGSTVYMDRSVTIQVAYNLVGGVVPFSGVPYQIQFVRTGQPPSTPNTLMYPAVTDAGASPQLAVTSDVFPVIEWGTVAGADRYLVSLSGDFGDGQGSRILDQDSCPQHDPEGTRFRVEEWNPGNPVCDLIPLRFGEDYTLTVIAENPMGQSPPATWTLRSASPLLVGQVPAKSLDIYDDCDRHVDHFVPATAASDFDPDNLFVYFKRNNHHAKAYWTGTHWQRIEDGKVGFPITHSEGLWEEMQVNLTQNQLSAIFTHDDFTELFWHTSTWNGDPGPSQPHGGIEPFPLKVELEYRTTNGVILHHQPIGEFDLLLTRLKLEPPPQEETCYFFEPQPTLTWQAVSEADAYVVKLNEYGPNGLTTLQQTLTSDTSFTPDAPLDPKLRYQLEVATWKDNSFCQSAFGQVYDRIQYLAPELDNREITFLDPPQPALDPEGNVSFEWEIFTNLEGNLDLHNKNFTVQMDGPVIDYPIHCVGRFRPLIEFYWTYRTSPTSVTHQRIFKFWEEGGVDAMLQGHSANIPGIWNQFFLDALNWVQGEIDASQNTANPITPLNWYEHDFLVKSEFGVAHTVPLTQPLPWLPPSETTVIEWVKSFVESPFMRFKFKKISAYVTDLNLSTPTPEQSLATGIPGDRIRVTVPFSEQLSRNDIPYLPEYERFRWVLWTKDRTPPKFWNGTTFVDGSPGSIPPEAQMKFGNHPDGTDPFNTDNELNWGEREMKLDFELSEEILTAEFFNAQQPDRRQFYIQLLYIQPTEGEPLLQSNTVTWNLLRPQTVTIQQFDMDSPVPSTVLVPTDEPSETVSFTIDVTIDRTPQDFPIDGFLERCWWAIQDAGNSNLYWNGTDWQVFESLPPDPTTHIGSTPFQRFTSPDFVNQKAYFSETTFNLDLEQIRANIGAGLFDNFFEEGQSGRDVKILLTYKHADGGIHEAQTSLGFLKDNLPTADPDWYDTPMAFVSTLEHARGPALLPPEPLFLQSETSVFWIIAETLTNHAGAFVEGASLNVDEYAWLKIPRNGDPFEIMAVLVPYKDEAASPSGHLNYSGRTATLLDPLTLSREAWETSGNLFYRYFENPNQDLGSPAPQKDRLVIALFVPESEVQLHRPIIGHTVDLMDDPQNPTGLFDGLLATTDPHHNRQLTITHVDSTGTKLYNLAFGDLLGRAQESRALGTHIPPGMTQSQLLVSGVTTLDALNRPRKTTPGYYTNVTPNNQWAVAGDRTQAFAAASAFWDPGNDGARTIANAFDLDLDGSLDDFVYLHGGSNPFGETIYENHERGRVLAQLPPDRETDAIPHLRYQRSHYFWVAPPSLDLQFQYPESPTTTTLEDVAFYHLHQETEGSLLQCSLVVDANGSVSAVFTGSDPDQPLITVNNPEKDLMRAWGLNVAAGAPQAANDLRNDTVYLPADYDNRIGKNTYPENSSNHHSRNLVSLNYIDPLGLPKASFPPRALKVDFDAANKTWSIGFDPQETNAKDLITLSLFDRYGNVIEIREPDAGISRFLYNDLGWLRFAQTAEQEARIEDLWTETIYDDVGRVLATREIREDDPSHQIQLRFSSFEEVNDTKVLTRYDSYSTETGPEGFASSWPSLSQLQAHSPFTDVASTLDKNTPLGQVAEVVGPRSAERFFYDAKGRPVCRVYLYRDLPEPHVFWNRFDGEDLLVTSFYANAGVGYRYRYDAWQRLRTIEDIQPSPARMAIKVHDAADPVAVGSTVQDAQFEPRFIGPLRDAAYGRTTPYGLAEYTYSPTGDIAGTTFGSGVSQWIKRNIRGWALNAYSRLDGHRLYDVDLNYHSGSNPLHDGTITGISERYGDFLEEADHITHAYDYDATYQLLKTESLWTSSATSVPDRNLIQEYAYDRNGNRLWERRDHIPEQANQPGDGVVAYDHQLDPRSNRLLGVMRDTVTNQDYLNIDLYDPNGNVEYLRRIDDQGNVLTRAFQYEDRVNPILPTRIEQTAQDSSGAFLPEKRLELSFSYDHNGARIKRSAVRFNAQNEPQPPEVTYYLPNGVDNAAEMDAFGRTDRAYLFAGEQRIGFKSHDDTALYLKDHLGSTKLTVTMEEETTQARTASNRFGAPESPDTNQLLAQFDGEGPSADGHFSNDQWVSDGGNGVYAAVSKTNLITSDLIPVDPAERYVLSGSFKSNGSVPSAIYYGLVPCDANGDYIPTASVNRQGSDGTVMAVSAAEITVAEPLSGWQPGDTKASRRGIGFYYDGDTSHLPDYVFMPYTSGNSTDPGEGGFNSVNGTSLGLAQALPAEVTAAIQLGVTVVKNHKGGQSYMYPAANYLTIPHQWTHLQSGIITGETWEADDHQFRKHTAFVKLVVIANSGQDSSAELFSDDLKLVKWVGEAAPIDLTLIAYDGEGTNPDDHFTNDFPLDDGGNGVYSATGGKTLISSDLIPVDVTETYRISGSFKSAGTTDSVIYFGFQPFDANQNYIPPTAVYRQGNDGTVTTITDTTITVAETLTGWQPGDTKASRRGIGIYYDGDTNHLPDYVFIPYTNGNSLDPAEGGYYQVSGSEISLVQALPVEVVSAMVTGVTVVKNHRSSSSYQYAGGSNLTIPSTWTPLESGHITGEIWGNDSKIFRQHTAYVKLVVLANVGQDNSAVLYCDDLKLEHVGGDTAQPLAGPGSPPVTLGIADRLLLKASDTGPYGLSFREVYGADGATEAETHLFTGQEKEDLLDLYYYGARWYMPEVGRFLQVDPARQFWNSYSYVGNKPITYVDLDGRFGDPFVYEYFEELVIPLEAPENAQVVRIHPFIEVSLTKKLKVKGFQGIAIEFADGEITNIGFYQGSEISYIKKEFKLVNINRKSSEGEVEYEIDIGRGRGMEFSLKDGPLEDGRTTTYEGSLYFFEFEKEGNEPMEFKRISTTKPELGIKRKDQISISLRGVHNYTVDRLNEFWLWAKTGGGFKKPKKIE